MELILMELSSSSLFFLGVNKYHSPPWFIVGSQYSLRVVYVKKSFEPPAGLYDYLSPNILFTKDSLGFIQKNLILWYLIIKFTLCITKLFIYSELRVKILNFTHKINHFISNKMKKIFIRLQYLKSSFYF